MINKKNLEMVLDGIEASDIEIKKLDSFSQNLTFKIDSGNYNLICIERNNKYSGTLFVESEKIKSNFQFQNLTLNDLNDYLNKKIYGDR